MKCGACGSDQLEVVQTIYATRQGDRLLVVENVPIVGCNNCGASWYTGKTLRAIERINQHRDTMTSTQVVDVAQFDPAWVADDRLLPTVHPTE